MRIPFSFLPEQVLFKFSRSFYGLAERLDKRMPSLSVNLNQAESRLSSIEYISMCLASSSFFLLFALMFSLIAFRFQVSYFIFAGISLVVTFLMFSQQLAYPKLFASRRIKGIERNLIPALQDMLVQLNSGVSIFNILVNLSNGQYGEISVEMKDAVREINTGRPQIDVLEDMAIRNPSLLFRRAIWQVVNGLKEGADIASLIEDVIRSVGDEQITQIQRYGGQLSPLALFYMLIAIIAPSLGITFVTIISTFAGLPAGTIKMVFYVLLAVTMVFQIMFIGMIKTRRPSLI